MQNYEYGIRYESEYLFTTTPRALEGVWASEGPWILNFIHFTVNPLLSRGLFIETHVFIKSINWYNWSDDITYTTDSDIALCISKDIV